MEAQSRGAFKDMGTPEQKRRFHLLAMIALIGVIGTIGSLGLLAFELAGAIALPIGIIYALLSVFILTGIIAGTLMQREVTRRL
jgi:amino acid transporter